MSRASGLWSFDEHWILNLGLQLLRPDKEGPGRTGWASVPARTKPLAAAQCDSLGKAHLSRAEMPALPFDLSFKPRPKHQVRGFRVTHPHGQRGAGQEQNGGDRSPKSPVTPFSGQFHMTCLVLWSAKPTLKMEFDITWYNGVNKWHSSVLLQQSQPSLKCLESPKLENISHLLLYASKLHIL